MKKFLIAGVFVASILTAKSQNYNEKDSYGIATINENYLVEIEDSENIFEFYVIDFSHLNLANYSDAIDIFGYISNNYLTYRVDFENQVAFLKIHTDRTPELKDVTWWKNYILNLSETINLTR